VRKPGGAVVSVHDSGEQFWIRGERSGCIATDALHRGRHIDQCTLVVDPVLPVVGPIGHGAEFLFAAAQFSRAARHKVLGAPALRGQIEDIEGRQEHQQPAAQPDQAVGLAAGRCERGAGRNLDAPGQPEQRRDDPMDKGRRREVSRRGGWHVAEDQRRRAARRQLIDLQRQRG
jgi:hypothetical protein